MYEEVLSDYRTEWETLFSAKYYIENLRSCGTKGKLENSHFRSISWMVFLECLPSNQKCWIESIKIHRQRYEEILEKFHVNPRKVQENIDISVNNPLSQSQQSPWNRFFQDSELKTMIDQDVVRTFPEIDFFQSSKIQKMMNNVLFAYARENPDVCYKQGMHELLAPIIYVLDCDQQAYLQVSKAEDFDLEIRILLNQNYIEHDAFMLFSQLMDVVKHWYSVCESPIYFKDHNFSSEPFYEKTVSFNLLDVKLKNIYKHLLKHHDNELFLHLEQMEITPQIYGIRWVRLLFGREFPIKALLILWDAIFADGLAFDLVDYIFVAMLIAIKDLLLKSDYTSCLRHLMHFPRVKDVVCIINLALYLRDPGMGKPDMSSLQVSDNIAVKMQENNLPPKPVQPKALSQMKSTHSTKRKENRPKFLRLSSFSKDVGITSQTISDDVSLRNENCDESFNPPSKEAYHTFPRTSIRNVMEENKSIKKKHFDISQSLGLVEEKYKVPKCACKEMVNLDSAKSVANEYLASKHKASEKEDISELQSLQKEISELKTMNEYCTEQITKNILKLQECMISQRLLHEDEMFIALAGLKRARDILKRTVAFNEEVMDDDLLNGCSSSSKDNSCCSDSDGTLSKVFETNNERQFNNQQTSSSSLEKDICCFEDACDKNTVQMEKLQTFDNINLKLSPHTKRNVSKYLPQVR